MNEDSVRRDFSWSVPVSGYRWVKAHPDKIRARGSLRRAGTSIHEDLSLGPGWYLVPREGGTRTYNPFESDTPIFRVFADTKPDRDGILEFANRYGCLGR